MKEKTKGLIKAAIAVILILIVVFSSFYTVSEQQNAVVTQFGKIVRTDTAGMYFKIPLLQTVHKVRRVRYDEIV